MKRRSFLAASAGALALLPFKSAAAPVQYTNGLVRSELAAGKTVFVDFTASWCSTCASQKRTIAALKAENPAYEQNVTFIDVDWDTYGNGKLSKSLNIPRRSTLVVLRGDAELGRIAAGTRKADIKALMDVALKAATA